MPKMKAFTLSVDYYSTLFHQLVLSTGHPTRLDRKEAYENQSFISTSCYLEELIAEMGACYLRSYAGLPIAEVSYKRRISKNRLMFLKG